MQGGVAGTVQGARRELRSRARRALGLQRLEERLDEVNVRVDQMEARLQERAEETRWRSRVRWASAQPDADLTWARLLNGDAFIARVAEQHAFTPDTAVLEVGPGYGRLAAACLERGVSFREYLGVDLSQANVEHLRRRFTDPRFAFLHADAEDVALDGRYDLLISSLTFKHLYPSFERTLATCAEQLAAGALVCFDLIEGDRRMFETDAVTYVRCYTRPEVQDIVERVGLELVRFTDVLHDADHQRLLTVARKP
jgi:SAM-dependent methyltransferase